jgi:malonyl-CoA decarboxylase
MTKRRATMLEELKTAARRATHGRQLRSLMIDCHRLLSERGEANSVAIARQLVERFSALPDEQQAGFFDKLSTDFSPDPQAVLNVAQAYAEEPTPENLIRLTRLAEPPRQELLRRINRTPGGTAQIVAMRRKLLSRLGAQPSLSALESDFHHLLSSWFNPGFLQMQQVDWRSPAELLEQIIRHEAVHEIDGWDDLRRRLQPDRRCFAFFHPQLPNEPLIFVEVALLPEMPDAIAPLIDKRAQPLPPSDFKVAAFYSISNCQPGLRGVSLGNFLIKRVAEQLQRELPQIRRYCTLSPVPGFAKWLLAGVPPPEGLKRGVPERLADARALLLDATEGDLASLASLARLQALDAAAQDALARLCASYLVHHSPTAQGDAVARFHLDNGARLERLNPLGDLSRKGLKQSFGMMVNYLYDLHKIEASHEQFVHGEVAHSRAVAALI